MEVGQTIYLDYHASTPVDPRVAEAMSRVMLEDFANPSSDDHALGWQARERVERARTAIAEAIGASPNEFIFTSGATEANNLGVLGAAIAAPADRRRILVSAVEHKSVLEAATAAQTRGFQVEIIPVTKEGILDLDVLEDRLNTDVAVVSVMATNNEIGVFQPIREISRLSAHVGAFTHCDMTQAPPAMAIDLFDWGVDGASLSSHKVYGPKGVGGFYLASSAPWRPLPLTFGGGQERGLRPGTLPTPLCVGFAEAMKLLNIEGEMERARVAVLRDAFESGLRALQWPVIVTCSRVPRHPGNLHVRFVGTDGSDLLTRLQPAVAASTGSACTSGLISPSHVLTALGFNEIEARECVRFSIGRFTTQDQLTRSIEHIQEALEQAKAARVL